MIINTSETNDTTLCKSIVKGDLVDINNIQVWVGNSSTAKGLKERNFYIQIKFNRPLDKNKYTVFVDTGSPGGIAGQIHGTAVINSDNIVKHNDAAFLVFKQDPIFNRYEEWKHIVNAGGIKFKFGILVDLE